MIEEVEIYPDKIYQSALEGLLLTTKGELVSIEKVYPLDDYGIPQRYILRFDTSKKRPSYDVPYINPETDPFGIFEKSLLDSRRGLYDFMGRVESTFCGIRERLLVFKEKG